MVSIKDVAKRAGVSTATVSHVINDTRIVARNTKTKVHQAMKELDYQINSAARSLRNRKSKIIALLAPITPHNTSSFFFMSIAQGIESVITEHRYTLLLSNSNENINAEKEQIKIFNSQLIDGLIIAPTYKDHGFLNSALKGDYPVVFVDRKPKNFNSDYVISDNAKVIFEAINLLIEKGHRHIGFISGSLGLSTSDERYLGYLEALKHHGIAINEAYIKVSDTIFSNFNSGYELTSQLLAEKNITALCVANNVMTMGALKCLQDHSINIPNDMALIGYDDYEWSSITTPPLTVIKQPSFELGRVAAQILLKRIENNKTSNFEEVKIPSQIVRREGSVYK